MRKPRIMPWLLLTSALMLSGACQPRSVDTPRLPASAKVSWGKPVEGLQAGFSAGKAEFQEGKEIKLSLHIRNAGKKPLKVYGAISSGERWRIVFAPEQGGVPRKAQYNYKPASYIDIALAEGQEYTSLFTMGIPGYGWTFEDARDATSAIKKAAPLEHLPPGKYSVKATYVWSEVAGSRLWSGKITTGAVEIEIKPKAKEKK